jgi:hypothetical protein
MSRSIFWRMILTQQSYQTDSEETEAEGGNSN